MSKPFADPSKTGAPNDRLQSGVSLSTPDWYGPLAMLVEMAQRRRIDLREVSLVDLVDACIASLSAIARVEDKADQLLLIADLALMKSRLLLGGEDGEADEEDALRQQALKLQRIQRLAAMLMGRDQLGHEIWARGEPKLETGPAIQTSDDLSIIDIVQAYVRLRLRDEVDAPIEVRRILAMTLVEALESLGARLEEVDGWTELFAWAGQGARPKGVSARSQAAASFVAALEMVKEGTVEISQESAFENVKIVATDI